MAGIYVHIPFCKKACNYCDFHFSTQLNIIPELVNAIKKDLILNKHYLNNEKIETIYFGGGTPSLLDLNSIEQIISTIHLNYNVVDNIEFTLEANPDDLTKEKIKSLKQLGINRLSIGLQSFIDEELKWMNRSHKAYQSINSVTWAQDEGIENISIDLIYGSKFQTLESWKKNINQVLQLKLPHISAYNLTIEDKTLLGKLNEKGLEPSVNDEFSMQCFDVLICETAKANFIHYEISNFGKEGFFSKHNSNYWKGIHYLGVGPSAHSYNGNSRKWNISNNNQYIRLINNGQSFSNSEELSKVDEYNEYVLTRLRTIWGVEKTMIDSQFGKSYLSHFETEIQKYLISGDCEFDDNIYFLTNKGKQIADKITSELFITSNF